MFAVLWRTVLILLCPEGCTRSQPFAVAGVFVRCLVMRSGVKNGNPSKKLRLAAHNRVCIGGQKKVWWAAAVAMAASCCCCGSILLTY